MSGGAGAKLAELVSQLRRPLGEMPAELEMCPVKQSFDVVVRPPGSKSLTNRALLLAGLAAGETTIDRSLIEADDAQVMLASLRELGVGIDVRNPARGLIKVQGVDGRFRGGVTLNLKNAGTATRFLAAVACLADAPVVIDGNERMRQRPIGELVAMLRTLGIQVDELGSPGFVPLRIHPCRPEGGVVEVGLTQSSQFISALMMLAPWTRDGIAFRFSVPPTSGSYIQMTEKLMGWHCEGYRPEHFGSSCDVRMPAKPGLRMKEYSVEPDASGATYFWAAAALVPRAKCLVPGLGLNSLQGDSQFSDVLRSMGADGHMCRDNEIVGTGKLKGVEIEMGSMPDAAMTAAAVACFASGPTTLRGLRTLRVKETDRLAAVQKELGKIGVKVEIESHVGEGGVQDELMRITPPAGGVDCSDSAPRVVFDTYDDHRMAMSLALIGLRRPNVVIRDPGCVAKTYPGFWGDWAGLYWERV